MMEKGSEIQPNELRKKIFRFIREEVMVAT